MFLGRRELRGSWSRYVVCRSYEASQYDGRVLSGYEAKSVIEELLRHRDEQQVRSLYAELTSSFDLRRVSNDEVQRWFSRELRDGARGVTGHVLVEVPMFGRLGHRGEPASSKAERLLHAMDAARGKSDLEHDGNYFRLALVARAGEMPGRDDYEALGAAEAQRLLLAMAENVRRPESVCELLKKAAALVAAGESGQSKEPLLLLRRHRSTGSAAERAEPPMTPAQFAKARQPKSRSYIAVAVYSQEGAPMLGVQLELTAPDGTISSVSTDDTGEAALHDLDPGSFRIAVLSLDLALWKAGGAAGQLLRKKPGRTHTVKQGECLSQLAHAAGIADWQKLWDHPDNAKLKAKRKSPNVLLPGDQLFIPGIEIGQIERPTDATHRITVSVEATEIELVLVLRDHEGTALKDEPYELSFELGGKVQKKTGQLTGSGELREKLPISVRSADLLLSKLGVHRRLAVGHLDPAKDEGAPPVQTGAQARLVALGYASSKAGSGPHADLRAAVFAFQKLAMGQSEPTGELDDATCAQLEEAYGV